MHAAILSIGDELTLGQTLDTNSAWLADRLAAASIVTVQHRTVPDDREAIAGSVRELAAAHEVLIITGGLGPTADDLTRLALGDVISPGEALISDPIAVDHVRARFARRGRPMPESNLVQGLRPASMRFLPNPNGTAMGMAGCVGRCMIVALPGPPKELQPMFLDHVLPALETPRNGQMLSRTSVHQLGLGESEAAERLGDLMRRDRFPLVGTTVSKGIVTARIRAQGDPAGVAKQLDEAALQIERCWRPHAYGRDGVSLAAAVGLLLRERHAHVVTAESCTGGLLGAMITEVAGASDYYAGGWVTYSNEMKMAELGVPEETLRREGAVSAATAEAMALGALEALGALGSHPAGATKQSAHGVRRPADCYSLAITGIAGPDGGTLEKPVGTVFVALGWNSGDQNGVKIRKFLFPGDREDVRDRSAKCALQMLRLHLLDADPTAPLLWETPLRIAASTGAAT